ncbi:Uncharacterized protein HZ326_12999 [Fusarium oxysporum f. sp. albedinis]|nr:Uncharacterized protein HZ326_12999 [Fusarium oxysporum f. sp. albedinis]
MLISIWYLLATLYCMYCASKLAESCPQLVAFRRCDGFGPDSAVCVCVRMHNRTQLNYQRPLIHLHATSKCKGSNPHITSHPAGNQLTNNRYLSPKTKTPLMQNHEAL